MSAEREAGEDAAVAMWEEALGVFEVFYGPLQGRWQGYEERSMRVIDSLMVEGEFHLGWDWGVRRLVRKRSAERRAAREKKAA